MIISDLKSDQATVLADAALYHQTTLGSQFVICGLPVLQVAHHPYPDLLLRNHLCSSATDSASFLVFLEDLQTRNHENFKDQTSDSLLFKELGIDQKGVETELF